MQIQSFCVTCLQVLVPKDDNLMGKMVEVKITSSGKHYLMGELVEHSEVRRPATVPAPLSRGQVSGASLVTREPEHPTWVKVTAGVVVLALAAKLTMRFLKNR